MTDPFVAESVSILERTPATLNSLLRGLSRVWTDVTEGGESWSPHSVIGHLVHAEVTDWMPRIAIILDEGETRTFDAFDRQGQFGDEYQKPLEYLLDRFTELREESLSRLNALNLQPAHLELRGRHPALGTVTLRQLLATWTAHDLGHIVQITRTMAKRYKQETGPWAEYLSVMR